VAETYREEKTFPAGRFRRGELLPEGEIVLIVITIVTGIIEIIITIIIIISTISITIPSHLTIAIRVVTCTIHPLYSTGVDYSFVVNAIEFCWRIIVMIRLFTIYLSPLIMISFMSCE
jgi:putative component of membrane protein insertase Oxa1/YidC/SpoIIIJ protein YidD